MLAKWSRKIKREETDLKSRDEGKESHSHSQQIKLNNFTVSLWDLCGLSGNVVHKMMKLSNNRDIISISKIYSKLDLFDA